MLQNVMAIDNGKIIGIPSAASGVSYDNTNSGLTSTNVQDALDEVSGELSDKVDKVAGKGLSTNDYDDTAKGIVDGVTSALAGKVSTSSVGSANGVAELDANGRVPSSQLPSYVDDVLEYADLAHFPATGETGKIYIAEDTNKTYRWSGSDYAEISESLALGETSSTAYAGNKGKANADAIAGIKDGANIDSFADVESALASKANSSDLGDKTQLTTTDKSSCVGAINEVNEKIVAGNIVDQTPNTTIASIGTGKIPAYHDSSMYRVWVSFPFIAKNSNYTITLNGVSQDNVGDVLSSATVGNKHRTGFELSVTGTYDYKKCGIGLNYSITFA